MPGSATPIPSVTSTPRRLNSRPRRPISHRVSLQKDKIRFYVKKPGAGRARFSVLKDTLKPDGRRIQEIVRDERIDAVNRAYKAKMRDRATCELEVQQVIESLYKPFRTAAPQFTEANRKLLDAYWDAEYTNRELADVESARNDLKRAIEAVGTLSLLSATQKELQEQIRLRHRGNKQRRIVARLNQLLKFAKRPFKLHKDKKEKRKVKYLNPDEFKRVLGHVLEPEIQTVLTVCFAIGCRVGEAFALTPDDIRGDVVHIDKQLRRDLTTTGRKRGGECYVLPDPQWLPVLTTWAAVQDKARIRNLSWPKIVRAACMKAFPSEPSKWISTHGLRHSYAVWLVSKGISLSLVAQSLGDSITVVEEHYSGFVLTPESIEHIRSRLKQA